MNEFENLMYELELIKYILLIICSLLSMLVGMAVGEVISGKKKNPGEGGRGN